MFIPFTPPQENLTIKSLMPYVRTQLCYRFFLRFQFPIRVIYINYITLKCFQIYRPSINFSCSGKSISLLCFHKTSNEKQHTHK